MVSPNSPQKKKINVGDIVLFEQCWEDTAGNYHDEYAEILEIADDGHLKLKWQGVHPSTEDFLNGCHFRLEDISYV